MTQIMESVGPSRWRAIWIAGWGDPDADLPQRLEAAARRLGLGKVAVSLNGSHVIVEFGLHPSRDAEAAALTLRAEANRERSGPRGLFLTRL